jgi:hypothetical protein
MPKIEEIHKLKIMTMLKIINHERLNHKLAENKCNQVEILLNARQKLQEVHFMIRL